MKKVNLSGHASRLADEIMDSLLDEKLTPEEYTDAYEDSLEEEFQVKNSAEVESEELDSQREDCEQHVDENIQEAYSDVPEGEGLSQLQDILDIDEEGETVELLQPDSQTLDLDEDKESVDKTDLNISLDLGDLDNQNSVELIDSSQSDVSGEEKNIGNQEISLETSEILIEQSSVNLEGDNATVVAHDFDSQTNGSVLESSVVVDSVTNDLLEAEVDEQATVVVEHGHSDVDSPCVEEATMNVLSENVNQEEKAKTVVSDISETAQTVTSADERTQVVSQPIGGVQPEASVQVSYGIHSSSNGGEEFFAGEAALIQAENLQVAQQRILDLEKEAERLLIENEDLAAAGETFRKRSDEKSAELEQLKRHLQDQKETSSAETQLLRDALSHKDKELEEKKHKVEELESRLSSDLKKIRVRERELENRIELMKLENQAIIKQKDETLMDLKRRVDQLLGESSNYRNKVQELNKQIDGNQDQFRRTVKALRLALTNLEVDEGMILKLKKVAE